MRPRARWEGAQRTGPSVHAAFERGDPNTRLNPSLRFRTCNREITIPFSRRAARIDGDARREGAWLGGSAATGRALTRHPARRRA